jgi:hypothetical protein
MARTRLRKFEEELQSAIETGMKTYSGHTTWNFVNGVLYCLDIATTIGEGFLLVKIFISMMMMRFLIRRENPCLSLQPQIFNISKMISFPFSPFL